MKSKLVRIILVSFLILGVLSCKKKKETQSEDTPPAVNTQPFMPSKIDSYLSHSISFEMVHDTLKFSYFNATAAFFNELHDKDSAYYYFVGGADVGKVTLNDIEVSKEFYPDNGTFYFLRPVFDASLATTNAPINWHIAGAGTFNELKIDDNFTAPKYSATESWPDTIYKSKDNVLTIGNYSGADNVTVYLMDVFNQGHTPIKTLIDNSKTVKFSGEDFFDFDSGGSSYVKVQIALTKNNYQKVQGKIFGFRTEITYLSRAIPIKYY